MWLVNCDNFFEEQIYSGGNFLFDYSWNVECGMEVDDVTRGDKMTRGRDDQGTK
jgi:hypothetical protein